MVQKQNFTPDANKYSNLPWLILISRLGGFTIIQACIALSFFLTGSTNAWENSLQYWPLGVIFVDILCLIFLIFYYRAHGVSYFSFFKFQRKTMKRDLLITIFLFLGFVLLSMAPNIGLAMLLFGNPQAGLEMMDIGIPLWVKLVSLIPFPLFQMTTEIPLYMLYCGNELQKKKIRPWVSFGLSALFLSVQHMSMPLILDGIIILYRLIMFIPLSIFIALVIYKKPHLLPYMIIIHGLMDLSLVLTMLFI